MNDSNGDNHDGTRLEIIKRYDVNKLDARDILSQGGLYAKNVKLINCCFFHIGIDGMWDAERGEY